MSVLNRLILFLSPENLWQRFMRLKRDSSVLNTGTESIPTDQHFLPLLLKKQLCSTGQRLELTSIQIPIMTTMETAMATNFFRSTEQFRGQVRQVSSGGKGARTCVIVNCLYSIPKVLTVLVFSILSFQIQAPAAAVYQASTLLLHASLFIRARNKVLQKVS